MTLAKKIKKFQEVKPRKCLNPFSPIFGVKVKPYLDANDIALATANCVAEFFRVDADSVADSEGKLSLTRYDFFENVKIAFDVVVLEYCTDINTQGLKWDALVGGGAMVAIRKKIKNYDEAWDMVKTALALKNTYAGLNLVARMIPNPEALEKNLRDVSAQIEKLSKESPDVISCITESAVKIAGARTAREEAKSETQSKKEA